jgi:hypothetical protein
VPTINPVLLAALAENRDVEPVAILYQGVQDGRWTSEDVEVWEGLGRAEQKRQIARARRGDTSGQVRGSYQTRLNRPSDPGRYRHGGYIAIHSSQATLDTEHLPAGAVRFLNVLLMRRKEVLIRLFTTTFARDLRCCVRTIQNWVAALVNAGYVKRAFKPGSKLTHLILTEKCFAMEYQERMRKRKKTQALDSSEPNTQKNADTYGINPKDKGNRPASSGTRGEQTGSGGRVTRTLGGSGTLDLPLVGGEMRLTDEPSPTPDAGHPTGEGHSAEPMRPASTASPIGKLSSDTVNRLLKPGWSAGPKQASAPSKIGKLTSGILDRFLKPTDEPTRAIPAAGEGQQPSGENGRHGPPSWAGKLA